MGLTESRRKTCGKIQATKQWLSRAEKHFDQDAGVRGELDLLLAEAELRSTREKLNSGRNYPVWFQHGLALGAAAVIMAFCVGGAWFFWHGASSPPNAKQTVVTVPIVVQSPPTLPISTAPAKMKEEEPPAAAVVSTNSRQEVNSNDKPVRQEAPVSPDEMKRLVRTAGQSLRGQPKP